MNRIIIKILLCNMCILNCISINNSILIKSEIPIFIKKDLNKETLWEALIFYNIKFPEIVYAQALLETGNFKSKICLEYNNIFGLYNSKTKNFYKYNHWSESVLGYKNMIQNQYNNKDCYYTFLKELPYAKDSLYIQKIKNIVNYDRRN